MSSGLFVNQLECGHHSREHLHQVARYTVDPKYAIFIYRKVERDRGKALIAESREQLNAYLLKTDFYRQQTTAEGKGLLESCLTNWAGNFDLQAKPLDKSREHKPRTVDLIA